MGKDYLLDYEAAVAVNGDTQNIRVRAAKEGLPVMLFLHGGPGVPDRHNVITNQSALAEKYTLVCWDQRGSGKSYRKSIRSEKLSLRTYVDDAAALIELLCEKFGVGKLVVAAHSWGTIIGMPLVENHPERIAAYIAQGVFVSGSENEDESYRFCLEEARRRGDNRAIKRLSGIRPVNGKYPNDKAMKIQRDYLSRYGGGVWKGKKGLFASILTPLIRSGEYSWKQIFDYAAGALYLSKTLWDDAVAADYRSVAELKVPVIVTQGAHDYNTPTSLAKAWFDRLDAPFKKWIEFSESAHSPINEESEKWGKEVSEALSEAGI